MKNLPRSRLARLTRAALPVAPLVLGVVPSAEAQVIFTPVNVSIGVGSSIFVDFGTGGATGSTSANNFAGTDVRLTFTFGSDLVPTVYNSGFNMSALVSGGYVANLAGGTTISSGLPGFVESNQLRINYSGNNNANWSAGTTGFVGFKFQNNTTPLLGWAEITYNNDRTLTLSGFAYESSGGSILAGAGAIPEPSTYALLGLGVLVAGSAALYRRRQQNKAAA